MKIVSVNIEKKKHLGRLLPFLQREEPYVVCVQEVMEDTVSFLSEALGLHVSFVPLVRLEEWDTEVNGGVMGIALLTKLPHRIRDVFFYESDPRIRTITRNTALKDLHVLFPRAVMIGDCSSGVSERSVTVATTHFTYTPDGSTDQFQKKALSTLLAHLMPYKNLIFTGDFNIPRPNELYYAIAEQFRDNIPKEIVSSLDPVLHRKNGLKKMVDYFWTKGDYRASNVHLISGVSDHCAVVGEIGWE